MKKFQVFHLTFKKNFPSNFQFPPQKFPSALTTIKFTKSHANLQKSSHIHTHSTCKAMKTMKNSLYDTVFHIFIQWIASFHRFSFSLIFLRLSRKHFDQHVGPKQAHKIFLRNRSRIDFPFSTKKMDNVACELWR